MGRIAGKKSGPKTVTLLYLDYFKELWNQDISLNIIADRILEKYNIVVDYQLLYQMKTKYPEGFNIRSQKVSNKLRGETMTMNKMLKSSRRLNIKQYLEEAKLKRRRG